MQDEDRLNPPKASKGDKAHMLVRAAVSAVPYVGGPAAELFAAIVQPPMHRRMQAWMEEVADCLRQLGSDRGVDLDELKDNDEFVDILLHATQTAMRTSLEEKRAALRNAVVNTLLPNPPEAALRHMFVTWVDEFTEWHLRILKLFQDPQAWAKQRDRRFAPAYGCDGLTKLIESAYPELRGKFVFCNRVWLDMSSRGLLEPEAFRLSDEEGDVGDKKCTTDLGDAFLSFIEDRFEGPV